MSEDHKKLLMMAFEGDKIPEDFSMSRLLRLMECIENDPGAARTVYEEILAQSFEAFTRKELIEEMLQAELVGVVGWDRMDLISRTIELASNAEWAFDPGQLESEEDFEAWLEDEGLRSKSS